jgi:hypothetical protein
VTRDGFGVYIELGRGFRQGATRPLWRPQLPDGSEELVAGHDLIDEGHVIGSSVFIKLSGSVFMEPVAGDHAWVDAYWVGPAKFGFMMVAVWIDGSGEGNFILDRIRIMLGCEIGRTWPTFSAK